MSHIRYAVRCLRRQAGLTTAAIVVLALGIGANTAMFTLVNAVILRSLPVEVPERLVVLGSRDPRRPGRNNSFSFPMYRDLADGIPVFSGVLARTGTEFSVSTGDDSDLVDGELVSGNYFQVLGVRPFLGRLLTPKDDRVPGGHPVAVLDHGYWMRRFGGDRNILGKAVSLNGHRVTIVGVTPPAFYGTDLGRRPAVRVPMVMTPVFRADRPDRLISRRTQWITLVARLAPGVTLQEANARAQVRYQQLLAGEAASFDETTSEYRRQQWRSQKLELRSGHQGFGRLRQTAQRPLLLLQLVTAAVWLIACVNLANLLFAKGVGRRREMAIRLAMGGHRRDLVRQLMAENVLLAACGGAAGVLFAVWVTSAIVGLLPPSASLADALSLDSRVLAATLLFSLLTALVFGLAPALRATRSEILDALKSDGGTRATPGHAGRTRSLLVVSQVALSLVLLVAATLFARSLANITRIDLGFEPHGTTLARVRPSLTGYTPDRSLHLLTAWLESLRRSPSVKHAAFASVTPFSGSWDQNSVRVEGYTARQDEDVSPSFATVTPEYFATVGIRLVRGRLFTERDTEASRKVAVVNETMARYFFGDRDPVGRTFEVERNVPIEIVGVVGDSKYVDPREELTRFVYLPLAQSWFNDLTLLVRTGGSTSQAAVLIRETLRALDPRVPLGEITTLDAQFDRALAMERVLAWMTSAFGALAMVLTGVGLYGVLAYSVASRTQEIGVRLALGARPADIGRMIARSTALLVAGGLLVGGMAAAVATQVLSGLLYGLSPSDPVTIGLAVGMVTGVTALAAAFPARHASRVDPVVALR